MIEPDELIELFISVIFIIIGIGIVIEIKYGTNITPLINGIIELAIPLFITVFIAVVIVNMAKEISN